MKKTLLVLFAALTGCAFAALDVIELAPGEAARPTAAAKVLSVRVLSSVAAGTATVKSVSTLPTLAQTPVVAAETNLTFTVVATNYVAGSLVTSTNTWAFDPYPFGHANWISFTTNRVVSLSTNWVETVSATLVKTNDLTSAITCSGGFGEATPSNKFIFPGEPLFFEGTAKGKVLVITER